MIFLGDNLKSKIDTLRTNAEELLNNYECNLPALKTPEGEIEATRAELEGIIVLLDIIEQQASLEGYKPLNTEKEILKQYGIIKRDTEI